MERKYYMCNIEQNVDVSGVLVMSVDCITQLQVTFCNFSRSSGTLHVLVLRVPLIVFTMGLNRSKQRSCCPLAQLLLMAEQETH